MAAAWSQDLPLLLPLPIILFANLAVSRPSAQSVLRAVLGALLGLQVIAGLLTYFSPAEAGGRLLGLGIIAGAGLALACLWRSVRAAVARVTPIDPDSPVHMLALGVTVDLVCFLGFQQLSADVVKSVAAGPPLTPLDVALQELPFLAAALLGVGLGTRRTRREVAARLGWVRPAWWQLALGLAAAGLFLVLSQGAEAAAQHFTPDAANRVNQASGRLYGGLQNPLGIAAIAILPGLCEEALFRGALQSRLGLAWTALVFAAVHTQYGLTVDAALILLLGLFLGLIRRFTNTTTSTLAHVVYNGLAGISLGALVIPGIVLETLLVAAVIAGLITGRRERPLPTPSP